MAPDERRRPGVQGARRPHPALPPGPAVRARRPHVDRAGVRAGDDPLRRDEAPAGARGGEPRGRPPVGPGEAALPQPGADPPDPRPLDRQVHRAPGLGAHRPQSPAGELMSTTTATTQVYRVYIRTTPEAVWDAITKPEWTQRYGYGAISDFDLRAGGRA